ncbi:MAG: hypothetical protein BGO70_00110 [Bacteroidetes bacterium 43-93]|nr:GyrI-like domain-containing protein [Bacteroidota bacterium]OJW95730.1 MAG: hypothetical protein BGO70_00110 [Bacteroidetes bacterium 43-93]
MKTTAKNQAKEIAWQGKTFMTSRSIQPFDKLTAFFAEKYGALYAAIGKAGIQANEPPCAIYYSIDEKEMVTDLAAAVPVPDTCPDIEGFTKTTIPACKALTITHYGSYDSMTETYSLLDKYLTEHNLKRTWALEQYLSDPQLEKDPANWKTNIYFGLE